MPVRLPSLRWTAHGVWLVVAGLVGLVATGLVLLAGPLPALVPVLLGLVVLGVGSPFWAVALFLLALPLGLRPGIVPTGPIDLVQLLAVFVVAVVVLQRITAGRVPLRWHSSAGWAVALAVLAVVAAVTARNVAPAVTQAAALVVAVALCLAVLSATPGWPQLRRLVTLLAVVGAGISLFSLGGAGDIQANVAGAGAVGGRAAGIFQSPNQLGTFTALLLFVGLGLALGGTRRLERLAGTACALASAGALTVSLSRGAWLGAGAALLVLMILSPRARRVVPLVLGAAAVAVPAVLAVAAPQLLEILAGRLAALFELDANPEDARPLIYQEAVRQIVDRPWTGQGPGNYALVMESADSVAQAVAVLHAHNVLLHISAEAGLIAAATLVAFTLSVARAVLVARRRLPAADSDVLLGLSTGLVAVVGQGLMDFTLGNPTLLFLIWVVVGLILAGVSRPVAGLPAADPEPALPAQVAEASSP